MRSIPGHRRHLEDEYWSWFAVALFLLLSVDLLTSTGAAVKHGIDAEINPIMRWFLAQDLVAITLVHLLVAVLAVYAFWGVLFFLRRTPSPIDRYFTYFVEGWLGLLVAAGLFLFANNMSVIVLGQSLI